MSQVPNPPPNGLYRATAPYPGREKDIPAPSLVYIGERRDGTRFVVKPQQNRQNTWYWNEPTFPLPGPAWTRALRALPTEGFYTLPEDLHLGGGGRWVKNAIVQLGYNGEGQAILFVGERREAAADNALYFSNQGVVIGDALLDRLIWAPILPVPATEKGPSSN